MNHGLLLTLATYLVLAIFFGISFSRFLTLWKASQTTTPFKISYPKNLGKRLVVIMKTAGDIIFLTRLLKTNDLLWIGEWIFHCSFFLVVLRHLRYILNPVPDWIWYFQTPGLIAGHILPLSLIWIFVVKIGSEDGYFPSYNFFLVVLLFFISVTGLLMKTFFRIDIVMAHNFMQGIFTFHPADAPASLLFIFHYVFFLVLLTYVPSHIFAAPFSIFEARKRDEEFKTIMHNSKKTRGLHKSEEY